MTVGKKDKIEIQSMLCHIAKVQSSKYLLGITTDREVEVNL